MCGIAGILDLSGQRTVPPGVIRAMAEAIVHRGPDEDGFLEQPGIALASRRLSIVGLFDGRQPISNEDRSLSVVFNGEIFDYPEMRARLEGRGHRFRTHCDTELIPHLWEDHGDGALEHIRGQFAFALWDEKNRRVTLARDRFGICPLYWTRQTGPDGDWLLFGSEIKAILASGMVDPVPDPRGIGHLFTFFALPGPVTCFKGISYLLPGHALTIQLPGDGRQARVVDRTYYELDFPDRGQEDRGRPEKQVVEEFDHIFRGAVDRRLRADVEVVSYLSGGVDSSTVVAVASDVRRAPIPTFTIRIDEPTLDETTEAGIVARHVGTEPIVVNFGPNEILNTYPRLIRAAEGPVIDTSCAALLLLAQEVHARGYKVALTGEGADEWLAGYPWYKIHRLLGLFNVIPGLPLSEMARRAFVRLSGSPSFSQIVTERTKQSVAAGAEGNPWLDIYGLVSISKLRFFSPQLREALADQCPYDDLQLNLERMRRWHPLNKALYIGARAHLPGLLLNAKGDRVAMHSSVETRYPFLDEEVASFLAKLDPRLKMKGLRDKYILRRMAERWLPRSIAWRRKAMFRAPFDSFYAENPPAYVEQLLSPESLKKTGYFDPAGVEHWRQAFRRMRHGSYMRTTLEMGLAGVIATQLWHQTYIDNSLADVPGQPASGAKGLATGAAVRASS